MAIPTNIKTLLSGSVVEWATSPKTMAKDNKERIHYIRKMSNTVEPSDDEEKDLFSLANRVPFDDRIKFFHIRRLMWFNFQMVWGA